MCEIFMVFFIQDYVICEQRKFFLIWMPFISFSCLSTFVICSVLCLISESGHPYLVTDLRGKAFHFFSLLSMMLAVGLLKYDLC